MAAAGCGRRRSHPIFPSSPSFPRAPLKADELSSFFEKSFSFLHLPFQRPYTCRMGEWNSRLQLNMKNVFSFIINTKVTYDHYEVRNWLIELKTTLKKVINECIF